MFNSCLSNAHDRVLKMGKSGKSSGSLALWEFIWPNAYPRGSASWLSYVDIFLRPVTEGKSGTPALFL